MMRKINSDLLNARLAETGQTIEWLASRAMVSFSMIEKMSTGAYKSEVKAITRRAICRALDLKEDDLFPINVSTPKKAYKYK